MQIYLPYCIMHIRRESVLKTRRNGLGTSRASLPGLAVPTRTEDNFRRSNRAQALALPGNSDMAHAVRCGAVRCRGAGHCITDGTGQERVPAGHNWNTPAAATDPGCRARSRTTNGRSRRPQTACSAAAAAAAADAAGSSSCPNEWTGRSACSTGTACRPAAAGIGTGEPRGRLAQKGRRCRRGGGRVDDLTLDRDEDAVFFVDA